VPLNVTTIQLELRSQNRPANCTEVIRIATDHRKTTAEGAHTAEDVLFSSETGSNSISLHHALTFDQSGSRTVNAFPNDR
jgi:hypothetical protein